MENFRMDENEILAGVEKDEWKSVGNKVKRRRQVAVHAKNTLDKKKDIKISLRQSDFFQLQKKSRDFGISYQSLISYCSTILQPVV